MATISNGLTIKIDFSTISEYFSKEELIRLQLKEVDYFRLCKENKDYQTIATLLFLILKYHATIDVVTTIRNRIIEKMELSFSDKLSVRNFLSELISSTGLSPLEE